MREFATFLFCLFLFIYSSSVIAGECENSSKVDITKIIISLEEERDLVPDIFILPVMVTFKAPEEIEVVNGLGKIDKKIRTLGIEYKGGQYLVSKNCWWEKDRQKCFGYIGKISYNFEFKEISEQNKIIEAIEEVKKEYGEKMNYEIHMPQWVVSEEEIKIIRKELQKRLIKSARIFAKEIGDLIEKSCYLSEVSFDTGFYRAFPTLYKSAAKEEITVEAPEPKKEEKTIREKAKITIFCK